MTFTSTECNFLYFLRKLVVIHNSIEIDWTETIQLLTSSNHFSIDTCTSSNL